MTKRPSDSDPDSGNERYYAEVPSRVAVTVVAVLGAAFGLLMVGSFLTQLSYAGGDEYVMLVGGLVICYFVWRFWSVTLGTYAILTPSRLIVRKIARTHSWKFDDITALASLITDIRLDTAGNGMGPPVTVHYLGIKTRNGKFSKVMLPEFPGNEALLKSLQENSLVEITELSGDEEVLKEWGKSVV